MLKGIAIASALSLFPNPAPVEEAVVEPPVQRVLQALTTSVEVPVLELEVIPDVEVVPLREKILAEAMAQVGVAQDCTDLVQNSFAALGLTTRRDSGGPDYGVQQLGHFFGDRIPLEEAQPGDIGVTGPDNGGHVWVIADPSSNYGVHGGWNGLQTVATSEYPPPPYDVYRIREGYKNDY